MDGTPAGPIVVGVDGSPASIGALRWAASMAAAWRCELIAVGVWEPHPTASYAPAAAVLADERERTELALTAAVRDVTSAVPALQVRQVPAAGLPARVLLRQAEGAELLVLGGHRRAAAFSPAAGPVALACLRGSPCPVVVVASDDPPPSSRRPAAASADQGG